MSKRPKTLKVWEVLYVDFEERVSYLGKTVAFNATGACRNMIGIGRIPRNPGFLFARKLKITKRISRIVACPHCGFPASSEEKGTRCPQCEIYNLNPIIITRA